ncbi:hypothetical protein [Cellulomonas sp. 73-92]|uniref:hypothetical protein n=1 Tax=Cellulomonas sp. 73-92 TaxID=1895740 RepID=UPI000AB59A33|nr:hypothetical protein [Cellulomonas sp. 73-92]
MSTNDEPMTPQDEELRRRTAAEQAAEQRQDWSGSVPEDSPGPYSGTGPLGTPDEELLEEVPFDSPGPESGTLGGVPLPEDRGVPMDSPGPHSGTDAEGNPLPESREVPEDSPGRDSGR